MSTGLECMFFSTNDDWYYVLQRWDCPVGAWDWMDYADCYGPFGSEDEAEKHLFANHANPGGSSRYTDVEVNETIQRLIDGARNPKRRVW